MFLIGIVPLFVASNPLLLCSALFPEYARIYEFSLFSCKLVELRNEASRQCLVEYVGFRPLLCSEVVAWEKEVQAVGIQPCPCDLA